MLNRSLKTSTFILLLCVGLGCLAAGAFQGYMTSKQALSDAISQRLTAELESKRQRVEGYLANESRLALLVANNREVSAAAEALIAAFHQPRAAPDPNGLQALQDWYARTEFAAYDRIQERHPAFEDIIPAGAVAQRLQIDYLATNPRKAATRANSTGAMNVYDETWGAYDSKLQELRLRAGFYDLMIADAKTGDIVYAAAQEPDFATNAFTGPYSQVGLGRVMAKALSSGDTDRAVIEDFSLYPPSGLMPQMLIGVPLNRDGETYAVILFQVDIERLNQILADNGTWDVAAHGRTGEVVLIKRNHMMLSQSRELAEHPDTFFGHLREKGLSERLISQISATGTSILRLVTDNRALEQALNRQSGIIRATDHRGVEVIEAFARINSPEVDWAIVAKQDVSEAMAPLRIYRNWRIPEIAVITTLALAALSVIASRAIAQPLGRITNAMQALQSGVASVRLTPSRSDEIGLVEQGFNRISDLVSDRSRRLGELARQKTRVLAAMHRSGQSWPDASEAAGSQNVVGEATVAVIRLGPDHAAAGGPEAGATRETLDRAFAMLQVSAASRGIEPVWAGPDCFVAVCGFPVPAPAQGHAAYALDWVQAAMAEVSRACADRGRGVELRAGMATGEVHVRAVADGRGRFDIWGPTVTRARFLALEASAGSIRVCEPTFDALQGARNLTCEPLIKDPVLGVMKNWSVAAVAGAALPAE